MVSGAVKAFGTPAEVITEPFTASVFNTDAQIATFNGRLLIAM